MSIPRGTAAAPVAVSVTSSATLLRAANTSRKALLICNIGALCAVEVVGLADGRRDVDRVGRGVATIAAC